MKTVLAVVSVLVGVVALSAATCCLPCRTTRSDRLRPSAPPVVVVAPWTPPRRPPTPAVPSRRGGRRGLRPLRCGPRGAAPSACVRASKGHPGAVRRRAPSLRAVSRVGALPDSSARRTEPRTTLRWQPAGKPWTFTQVAGDQKVLTLAGESAPHGRPRASPVVEDEMALRDTAVYYPGNRRPTRHLFGEIHTDWTLNGRFSDRFLGPAGARAKVLEIKEFIADQQQVTIAWGDILAATGLVRRIKPSRESESEIAWTLTVGIDGDDALPPARRSPSALDPAARSSPSSTRGPQRHQRAHRTSRRISGSRPDSSIR